MEILFNNYILLFLTVLTGVILPLFLLLKKKQVCFYIRPAGRTKSDRITRLLMLFLKSLSQKE